MIEISGLSHFILSPYLNAVDISFILDNCHTFCIFKDRNNQKVNYFEMTFSKPLSLFKVTISKVGPVGGRVEASGKPRGGAIKSERKGWEAVFLSSGKYKGRGADDSGVQ